MLTQFETKNSLLVDYHQFSSGAIFFKTRFQILSDIHKSHRSIVKSG